jgi:hypothetical protein
MTRIRRNVSSLMALSWPSLGIYDMYNDAVSIPRYIELKYMKQLQYIIKKYGQYKFLLFMLYKTLHLKVTQIFKKKFFLKRSELAQFHRFLCSRMHAASHLISLLHTIIFFMNYFCVQHLSLTAVLAKTEILIFLLQNIIYDTL